MFFGFAFLILPKVIYLERYRIFEQGEREEICNLRVCSKVRIVKPGFVTRERIF